MYSSTFIYIYVCVYTTYIPYYPNFPYYYNFKTGFANDG